MQNRGGSGWDGQQEQRLGDSRAGGHSPCRVAWAGPRRLLRLEGAVITGVRWVPCLSCFPQHLCPLLLQLSSWQASQAVTLAWPGLPGPPGPPNPLGRALPSLLTFLFLHLSQVIGTHQGNAFWGPLSRGHTNLQLEVLLPFTEGQLLRGGRGPWCKGLRGMDTGWAGAPERD